MPGAGFTFDLASLSGAQPAPGLPGPCQTGLCGAGSSGCGDHAAFVGWQRQPLLQRAGGGRRTAEQQHQPQHRSQPRRLAPAPQRLLSGAVTGSMIPQQLCAAGHYLPHRPADPRGYFLGDSSDSAALHRCADRQRRRHAADFERGSPPGARVARATPGSPFVRQRPIYETQVAPGAFAIDDLYATSFAGDLDVTITGGGWQRSELHPAVFSVVQML